MLDSRWSRLSLTYLPGDDPATDDLVQAARTLGWRSQVRPYERTVEIDLAGGLAEVESRLSGKKRANLRRRRRRLGELGALTLTINDGRSDRREDLDTFIALEASGWKGPHGSATAIACRPESRRFFAEMTEWAAAAGTLRLSFVRLDGRPVAALLGLEDGDAYYAVRTAYDESCRQHSPSDVLLHHHIADLCEKGVPRLVILGRDEPYKREWSEQGQDHVLAHLFPPTLAGRVQWFGYQQVRPAVVWAREHARRRQPPPPSSSAT
jgi:CelD/BcsL family acetyltransferase involved in cellulose biosynthesis